MHFFEAFGRMLAFLEDPGAGNRRGFYGILLNEVMAAAGCEQGSLLLVAPSGQELQLRLEAVHGLASEVWAGENGAAADSAAGKALALNAPVLSQGAFGASLALPLQWRGEAVGAVLLSRERPFDGAEVQAAAASASGLAQVLKAFQSLAQRRRTDQQLASIINASVALQGGQDQAAVLDRIIREAEVLLDAEAASVFLLDPDGGLRAPVATGPGGERLQELRLAPGEGIAGWVVANGAPAVVSDVQRDGRFARRVDRATSQSTRSVLAVPIVLEGRTLGVLEVINKRGGGVFRDDEAPALGALALLAGAAIESSSRVAGLSERARRLDAEVARATLAANEARNRLESVLFAMDDAVLAADENGLATLLNRTAQFMAMQSSPLEPLGRSLEELLPAPAFAHAMREVRSSGESRSVEIDLGREPLRSYAVVLAPIRDLEGYLTGFVVVLRDITRFRELERMKTSFLNTVSHELRTPITSIRAFSELMARADAEPAKVREWSAVINEESERLNRLVDDLLDVSRIESGKKLSVVKRPVELRPLVERVAALFHAQAQAHPISLALNEDLTHAELDPDRIEQVLTNLVSNAIKYSPQGGSVEVCMDFLPPGSLRFEVADHGVGLKEEDRLHMFEKFYRVEGAQLTGIRGTGLGLAISKYLVEAHGGRIGVESRPGEGSTFWFELPLFSAGPAK